MLVVAKIIKNMIIVGQVVAHYEIFKELRYYTKSAMLAMIIERQEEEPS